MNRRIDDPNDADWTYKRSLCVEHHNGINELKKDVKRIDCALYGNGDPKHGIVWKIESNTDFIQEIRKHWGWMVRIALGGALSAIGLLVIRVVQLLWEHNLL